MRHITLESYLDNYGNLGLIIAGTPKFDDLTADTNGGLIAHDLLEHQNGIHAIGTIPDEIEAVGALWQVRGRHADFAQDDPRIGRHWTPEQNTILNLSSLARDAHYSDWTPRIGQYHTRAHYEDETFRDMLDWVRPHVEAELDDDTPLDVEAFLENALHLLRTGYRKAERRFGPHFDGLDQFKAIKRAIHPHCQHLEAEGQTFRLSYGKGEARCDEVTWSH